MFKPANSKFLPPPLPGLILSLEHATIMAKQLSSTIDPTHLLQTYTFLQHAHQHLFNVLSRVEFPFRPVPSPLATQNSFSLTGITPGDNRSKPMQVGDDDEVGAEENAKGTIEKVEEKRRYCFIKNKCPKQQLSLFAVTVLEELQFSNDRFVKRVKDYDPHTMTRLRALDLVSHG